MPGDRRVTEPNYTQVPNELLDDVIPQITSIAELKVTLAIVRQTFGFHRGFHLISLTDLEKLTGLTRQGAQNGVTAAMERGYVARRRGEGNAYLYGIRVQSANDVDSQGSRPVGSQGSRPGTNKGKKNSPTESRKKARGGDLFVPEDTELDRIITELFEAWHTGAKQNGRSRLTVARAGEIRGRIKEVLAFPDGDLPAARAELLDAVKGLCTSPWHLEKGELGFDLIFRNRKRVDFCLERLAKTQSEEPDAATRFAAYDQQIENRGSP